MITDKLIGGVSVCIYYKYTIWTKVYLVVDNTNLPSKLYSFFVSESQHGGEERFVMT